MMLNFFNLKIYSKYVKYYEQKMAKDSFILSYNQIQ